MLVHSQQHKHLHFQQLGLWRSVHNFGLQAKHEGFAPPCGDFFFLYLGHFQQSEMSSCIISCNGGHAMPFRLIGDLLYNENDFG